MSTYSGTKIDWAPPLRRDDGGDERHVESELEAGEGARVADARPGPSGNIAHAATAASTASPNGPKGIGKCARLPEEAADGQNHGGGDEPRPVQAEERCAKCVRHWLPIGLLGHAT